MLDSRESTEMNPKYWQDATDTFEVLLATVPPRDVTIPEYLDIMTKCGTVSSPSRGESQQEGDAKRDFYYKVTNFIKEYVLNITRDFEALQGDVLLVTFSKVWERYRFGVKIINDILKQALNTLFQNNQEGDDAQNLRNIFEEGVYIWQTELLDHFKSKIVTATMHAITEDRQGNESCTKKVKGVIESIYTCSRGDQQYFCDFFQTTFINETKDYYKKISESFLAENSVAEYLFKAEKWIAGEHNRVEAFLVASVEEPLMTCLYDALVVDHLSTLTSAFLVFLQSSQLAELTSLYNLLSKPKCLEELWPVYESHVQRLLEEGINSLLPPENEKDSEDLATNYVAHFASVYRTQTSLIKQCVMNNSDAYQCRDKAFKVVVNKNAITARAKGSTRSAQLVAVHVDKILKANQQLTDEQNDEQLNDIINVFRYLDDRDVFAKYYSTHLSGRLLKSTSTSDSLEQSMISKLQLECGLDYTNKLLKMFTDVDSSNSMYSEFKSILSEENKELFKICPRILVLSSNYWQALKCLDSFSPPQQCMDIVGVFENYYSSINSSKKLTWIHNHANGELRAKYLARPLDLQCSTVQMAILLGFEKSITLSFQNLQEITLLPEDILEGNMKLLLKSHIIILGEPEAKEEASESKSKSKKRGKKGSSSSSSSENVEIDSNTLFSLDVTYSSRRKKLNINRNVPMRASADSEKTEDFETSRKLQTQAAMVRIMKMRRECTHKQLLVETSKQLASRFPQTVKRQKRAIEYLLQEEYMERIENNSYRYLA